MEDVYFQISKHSLNNTKEIALKFFLNISHIFLKHINKFFKERSLELGSQKNAFRVLDRISPCEDCD
jgi:hypothetical protein